MYIVTTENIADGFWNDEPQDFHSEAEARNWIKDHKPPSKFDCFVLYACREIESFNVDD